MESLVNPQLQKQGLGASFLTAMPGQSQNATRCAVAMGYFPLNSCMKKWSNVQQITFRKNPILTKIISMETSCQEIKPIALEKDEFEHQQNRNNNGTFGIFSVSRFVYMQQSQRLFYLTDI